MATLITDHDLEERLIAERQSTGADRYDEVWDGTYMMTPLANIEHQFLIQRISQSLQAVLGWDAPPYVFPGVNLSDRRKGWENNFRCPDLAVFLAGNSAVHCGTHWCGGPDWLMEIASTGDHTRQKVPFYSQIGVGEMLILDRQPWRLELYQPRDGALVEVARASVGDPALQCAKLPISFALVVGKERPGVEIVAPPGGRWVV